MKRERGEFRAAANNSKSRLCAGFWQSTDFLTAKESIEKEQKPMCEFEKRVRELVESGDPNPVTEMLDKVKLVTLFGAERDRYVMETSNRVKEIVAKINSK